GGRRRRARHRRASGVLPAGAPGDERRSDRRAEAGVAAICPRGGTPLWPRDDACRPPLDGCRGFRASRRARHLVRTLLIDGRRQLRGVSHALETTSAPPPPAGFARARDSPLGGGAV